MKRIFGLLCVLLLLTGCAGGFTAPDYESGVRQAAVQPFTFVGTLTLAELAQPVELRGQAGCDGLLLELLSPPGLAGMTLKFEEESIRVQYRELVLNLEEGDIPESSVFVALSRVLPCLSEGAATQKDGLVLLEGAAGSASYKAMWQGEPPTLLWLEIPTCGAKIEISEFSVDR